MRMCFNRIEKAGKSKKSKASFGKLELLSVRLCQIVERKILVRKREGL